MDYFLPDLAVIFKLMCLGQAAFQPARYFYAGGHVFLEADLAPGFFNFRVSAGPNPPSQPNYLWVIFPGIQSLLSLGIRVQKDRSIPSPV